MHTANVFQDGTLLTHIPRMGFLDACTNPVRTDATGRRVIVPWRGFGPVLLLRTDADAARAKRVYKRMFVGTILLISVGARWLGYGMIPIALAFQLVCVYLVTRGLPSAGIRAVELPRLPRGEAVARSNEVIGKPLLWTMRAVWPLMSGFMIWGAIEFGGAVGWVTALFAVLLNFVLVYEYLQERAYRRSVGSPAVR
ncbi:MAG: hypothetical protein M3R65_12785 [Gemmatimonadota bacterium]|nr:hypothetical protein [Gemmatimonadota bacterium]